MIQVVLETHAISEDNEHGIASGWCHSRLSPRGRLLARVLGDRRRDDGIRAVFTSDLLRAIETAELAFGESPIPIFHDWRLRECDYGELNGAPRDVVHGARLARLYEPYPGGESWQQALRRVRRCLDDLPSRWEGARVLLIGHIATRWALEHYLGGRSLEDLVGEEFRWREGWEYLLEGAAPAT